jgi:hypothetical protein
MDLAKSTIRNFFLNTPFLLQIQHLLKTASVI